MHWLEDPQHTPKISIANAVKGVVDPATLSPEDQCAICQEAVECVPNDSSHVAVSIRCGFGHFYRRSCIHEWLAAAENRNCPL